MAEAVSFPRCPFRFNFNYAFRSRRVMNETAPRPVFWPGDKPTFHRIAVDVAQLLHTLRLAPYRKIVIANLPKVRKIVPS